MLRPPSAPRLHISPAPAQAVRQLADFFVAQAAQAIQGAQKRFTVVLSGGSSPRQLYELLASPAYRDQVAWEQVYFFFGDERHVPPDHPDSNYGLARATLLAPLRIDPSRVFAVDTARAPDAAALYYTHTLERFFAPAPPHFDLVLLGLGDNAHTASLFPHTPVLHDTAPAARAVTVAARQPTRITLTAPLLNQAQAVAFLVYGADKAEAVQHVLGSEFQPEAYPAQLIAPQAGGVLHWYLDAAAAKLLV